MTRLGAVHTYARPEGMSFLPTWLHQMFYPVPGRFQGYCDGQWRYGSVNEAYAEEATDSGYGSEEEDNPPGYAPDGMSAEEYAGLNLAEQKLVWAAFQVMTATEFIDFLQMMRSIRTEAESWAAQKTSLGEVDGPQDAYRHAYWQCRMTQQFGVHTAKAWGDAHEKYQMSTASGRMDLANNAFGRRIGLNHASCADGISENAEGLRMGTAPPPSFLFPEEPPPAKPEMDS